MSHRALQRVVVRMLYDPVFAATATSQAEGWFGMEQLTSIELRWLRESEGRAWILDPMRRTRTLAALLDEYPVSLALAFHRGGTMRTLDGFFSAERFHHALMNRASLALAFGKYLQEQIAGLDSVEIEHAIARVRRSGLDEGGRAVPADQVSLSARVRVVAVPQGSFDHYARWVHAQRPLKGNLEPLLTRTWRAPAWGPTGPEVEWVLVEPMAGEPVASTIPEGLAGLLRDASRPRPVTDLIVQMQREGLSTSEAEEVIAELVNDGLLIRSASP